MQIAAGLMTLWVAYCWFLFIRKRYEPLFVVPMACFSIFALLSIAIVFFYNDRLPHPGGQLFGVFLMMALITGATLKPSRNFVWLVIALTAYRIVVSLKVVIADPSALPIAFIALEIVAVLSLFYLVQFRPATLDVHAKGVKSVFD